MIMISRNNNNNNNNSGGGGGTVAKAGTGTAAAADPRAEALRCPRCDSANTKFCYYNNYSLAQPRHFCKACKRYWTRGGTLRNVPVGGGCRKNKRSKKHHPSSASSNSSSSAMSTAAAAAVAASSSSLPIPPLPAGLTLPSSSSLGSLLFPSSFDMNISFPTMPAASAPDQAVHFDLQPQLDMLGLGYGQLQIKQQQQQQQSESLVDAYLPLFSSSLASASLLVPGLDDEMAAAAAAAAAAAKDNTSMADVAKDVKMEGDCRLDWQVPCEITAAESLASASMNTGAAAAAALTYWNGGWSDMTNCGSSLTPLF